MKIDDGLFKYVFRAEVEQDRAREISDGMQHGLVNGVCPECTAIRGEESHARECSIARLATTVLAERERCAKIVESYVTDLDVPQCIAEEIRKGK